MNILSERLSMVPITVDDWSLFYRLHTDPDVIAWCFDEPSRAEIEEKFHSRLQPWSFSARHWLCLVIYHSDTHEKIGITGYRIQEGVAEVGFMLLPQYHGLGYGSESLNALIDYSTEQFGLDSFTAVVTEGNVGSEKVLQRCGFTLASILPNAYEIGGHWYADHLYQRIPSL